MGATLMKAINIKNRISMAPAVAAAVICMMSGSAMAKKPIAASAFEQN
jgi:hypothetical protein